MSGKRSSHLAKAIESLKIALDQLLQFSEQYEQIMKDAELYKEVKPLIASLNKRFGSQPENQIPDQQEIITGTTPTLENIIEKPKHKKKNKNEPTTTESDQQSGQ